jgi:phosphatidylglycerol lysyltransferase
MMIDIARYRKPIAIASALGVLALGFAALHHLAQTVNFHDVRLAFHAIPSMSLGLALLLTTVSYLALTLYDVFALRVIGRPLPWRTAALASFTSYTLSHNLGLALLTGGSARYRIYSAAGLDGSDIARVIAIASAAFWSGVVVIAGVALIVHSGPLMVGTLALPASLAPITGAAILALAALLMIVLARRPTVLKLWRWSIPLPTPGQALAQIGIAVLDLTAASAALFVLVPVLAPAAFPAFLFAYALAIIVAVVSHVPGGIGIFEAVIVATVPGDRATLLAALIAYRVIYYLLPLAIAAAMLAIHEGRRWHAPAARSLSGARTLASGVAPLVLSVSTFLGGGVLLLSGALPALSSRLHALQALVPLPFIEAAHIAASLVGTALLLLAPGLYRRLDGAFVATRALLIVGAILSLLKGADYEEAVVLLAIAGLLQWTRPAFYRRTALVAQPLSPQWLICVVAIVGLSLWAGLFAYQHVAYQDTLWWDFALRNNASRFLRASLAVALFLIAASLWRLFSPARIPATADTLAPEVFGRALETANRTDAMLALTGDKRFLVSDDGDAFLMYQVKGSSWIVMGDPVGPRLAWPDLFWAIRAQADAAQGRLLFYQLSADALPLAIDLGLHIVKYGEEALVDLRSFSLDGPQARGLRHADRRAAREGMSFSVIPASEVAALLPELRAVSDAWLAAKGHGEKTFSLGRFDACYLCRFDCAIIRQAGRIVAFANIWATPNRNELSLDLMRHADATPPGTMDFLFVQLMLWGQAAGYARFSLGLAPLSGIEAHRLSPIWAKTAALLFKHGERLYGFKGLRAYKDKFNPRWEPRYIAGSGGIAWVPSLFDLQSLVGRARPPRAAARALPGRAPMPLTI